MHADLEKVRRILSNLVSNAAKFTSNGVITIEAARSAQPDGKDMFLFKVRDTGIGIADERIGASSSPLRKSTSRYRESTAARASARRSRAVSAK